METQQQTQVQTDTTAATSVSSLVSSWLYFWWKLTQSSSRKTPAVSEKQNLVETGVIGLLPLTNDFLADPLRQGLPKQDWKNSSANWCLFKGPAHCHACKNTVALMEHTEPPVVWSQIPFSHITSGPVCSTSPPGHEKDWRAQDLHIPAFHSPFSSPTPTPPVFSTFFLSCSHCPAVKITQLYIVYDDCPALINLLILKTYGL